MTASIKPGGGFSALLQYSHTRENGLGTAALFRGTANPPFGSATNPWFNSYPTDGFFLRNRGHVLTGNFTYELNDNVTISYLPSYMRAKSDYNNEFGFLFANFTQSVKQYSQELRLSGNSDRLKWLLGLYWYKSNSGLFVKASPAAIIPPIVFVNLTNRLKSYAGFGQVTYSITDALRLTVGGRYSSDGFNGGGNQIVIPTAFSEFYNASKRKGRADWKLGAEYDVGARSMLYATVQSGYLQGGWTQTDVSSPFPKTFKPVKLVAFTAGSKNRFLDNRLQINNEVFYYSYKDYQTQTVTADQATGQTAFLVFNLPKSEIYGDQLDIAYSVDDNTDLNFTAAYLHTKITKGFPTPPTAQGLELPNSPKWTLNGSIEHRFPLANGAKITARVASSYNSGYWLLFTHVPFSRQKSFTKTDVNLTYYGVDDKWYFGTWGRNLEKSAVYYGSNLPDAPGLPILTSIDAPRTYGVRAGFKF